MTCIKTVSPRGLPSKAYRLSKFVKTVSSLTSWSGYVSVTFARTILKSPARRQTELKDILEVWANTRGQVWRGYPQHQHEQKLKKKSFHRRLGNTLRLKGFFRLKQYAAIVNSPCEQFHTLMIYSPWGRKNKANDINNKLSKLKIK